MTDNREVIMFKKVQDGYVFRALNPFVFGRARFYLANEAQKAQLLAIVTARSQAVFWVVLVVSIAVSTSALAYVTGHDNPTIRDVVVMLALIPLWIYAALLVSVYPIARRLQPILAGLEPTDQSITTADLRKAVRSTVSFRQYVTLGVSQAITSAALVIMALQGHDRALIFQNSVTAAIFVVSSIGFLIAAMDKARHKRHEPELADKSFKSFLVPLFALVVSLGLLGFVVTNALRTNERNHGLALTQDRLASLTARIEGSKVRSAANNALISELIAKINNPAVKCESSAVTDGPGRAESIKICRELARKEKDAVQRELAATNEESAALRKENDAIETHLGALQKDIKAMRR